MIRLVVCLIDTKIEDSKQDHQYKKEFLYVRYIIPYVSNWSIYISLPFSTCLYRINKQFSLNIVKRISILYWLVNFLIVDLQKDIKKYKAKLVIITGD